MHTVQLQKVCICSFSIELTPEWILLGVVSMITADDEAHIYFNGKYVGYNNRRWNVAERYLLPLDIQVVAIYVVNTWGSSGLIGSFANGIVTDSEWNCTTQYQANWQTVNFDDSNWPAARLHQANSGQYRVNGVFKNAIWIGVSNLYAGHFYCRRRMTMAPAKPSVGKSKY